MRSEDEIREMVERLDKEMDALIHEIVNFPIGSPQDKIGPTVRRLASTSGKIDALRWVLGDRDEPL